MTKQEELYELCIKFRDKHDISCPETISQVDNVIVDAYRFIEDICDIIGYREYEDDE